MASRRMFSKRIINSARFLKMPVSTQALYFHLGLNADDDGIVEAYTVMNSIGVTEDDLKILVAKNFVIVLNEDLVSYITDWQENNKIRADRKVDSIYKDLLIQMLPDVEIQQKRQRADVAKKLLTQGEEYNGQPMDNQWTSNGQPMDSIGKDRLGKDSIDKNSIDKDNVVNIQEKKKKTKHKYGEYKNVLLTDEEYNKLLEQYGSSGLETIITYLDEYIEMKGTKYKSHYLVIKKWGAKAALEQRSKEGISIFKSFLES